MFPEPLLAAKTELQAFTGALFHLGDLVELREIESWDDGEKRLTRHVGRDYLLASKIAEAWPRLHQMNTRGANIYFGVNPRTRRGGTKQHVRVVRSIWMDLDGVSYDEARARWKPHLPAEPTIIVGSGSGIHAYWEFRRPFLIRTDTDLERFERMLRAIYRAVGADSVQDVCRVLRLPGFLNVKSLRNGLPPVPCRLLECDPKRTYPFSTFSPWWERAKEEVAVKTETTRTPPASTAALEHSDTKELVAELDRSVSDRSRRDYAIILGLLRSGLAADEIWLLVRDKSKFCDRGRPYFDTTIHNAMRTLKGIG